MAADGAIELGDAGDRRRAATGFETNLVVSAGAGTGKTSLLVERVLNALGGGVAGMDAIAAITFTEKAAGEMRERLAVGLDRLRTLALRGGDLDEGQEADRSYRYLVENAGVERDELARRCLEAMEQLDQGTVTTIHGFCAELLRAYPVEAEIDPGFTVDTGERAEPLAREIWEEFVRDELGPEASRPEEWERVLTTFTLAEVGEIARKLAGFGVPLTSFDTDSAAAVLPRLQHVAEGLVRRLVPWLERNDVLSDLCGDCLRGMHKALEALRAGGLAAFRTALPADGELAGRIDKGGSRMGSVRKKAAAPEREAVEPVRAEARAFCRDLLRAEDEPFDRLVRLVKPFVERYRERYLAQGWIDFDGLLALARDLLRDRPEVRRRLKERFRLLLVDEFQDTDPLQYEIVLFLAERIDEAASHPLQARLAPGRLFVVGDPKQSIYRFRGADYAAYKDAIDCVLKEKGEELGLDNNFRSVPGILEPVNRLFTDERGCWSEEAGYQAAYASIEPARAPTSPDPAVDVWTIDVPKDTLADDRREAEGRVIAETIERWIREGKCKHRKITILLRAFTNLSIYLRALRERNIPFVVDGGRDFLERPEVAQLMATLRAIDRPADQPALLAYLRSPAGAVSDEELARYAAKRGTWDWRSEPPEDRFPNLARAFRTLRGLRDESRGLSADRFVRRVLERTAMLPLGALAFEGPQRVANLQKLAAAVGGLARDGRLSLEEILEALEERWLSDIESDRPLADDDAQAVRVTNIHRIKGLQNDVIILPDLARKKQAGRENSDPVCVSPTRAGEPILALKSGTLRNSARAWYDLENRKHEEAEEVRVLYVALTRARERLVLVGAPTTGKPPWLEALKPWDYDVHEPPADGELIADERVRHRLCPEVKRPRRAGRDQPQAEVLAATAYEEVMTRLRETAGPPLSAPSRMAEEGDGEHATDPAACGERAVRRAAGIALHRLLERWDGADPGRLPADLDSICAEIARDLDADPEAVGREAHEILDAFLASDLADRFAGVERLGTEVPVLVHDDEARRTYRGNIDLLYKDADGEPVVVDFKTDRTSDPAELQRRYGQQLGVYAAAVQRAYDLPAPPRAELWLLRTGQVVPISADGADPTPPGDRG